MKRLFFILIISYLNPSIGQDWNLDKVDFNGKVKHVLSSYKSLEYENDFDHVEVWFNQKGKLTKKSGYYEDWQETNEFQSKVRILDKEQYCQIEYTILNGDTASYKIYEYDSLIRITKSSLYTWGELYNIINYKYNIPYIYIYINLIIFFS